MYELELIECEREPERFEVELRSAEEVKRFYRSLCDSSRSTALDFVGCSEVFRSFGLLDEALECYGEGLARDSGCLQAYVMRGELLFQLAVCSRTDEEIARLGWRSVDDFRKALVLSLGANEVVWRLGIALLLVDDAASVEALADNVLMKGEAITSTIRCDFLYLLGLAKVFRTDRLGADEVFEELVRLDCGVESGWFGKLVSCLVLADRAGAEGILTQLHLRDVVLWEAGQSLERSGCSRFIDVAKAFLDVGTVAVAPKFRGNVKGRAR
jgi:hypothetical protein